MKRKPVKRKPLPDPKRIKGVVIIPKEEMSAIHRKFVDAYAALRKWYRS